METASQRFTRLWRIPSLLVVCIKAIHLQRGIVPGAVNYLSCNNPAAAEKGVVSSSPGQCGTTMFSSASGQVIPYEYYFDNDLVPLVLCPPWTQWVLFSLNVLGLRFSCSSSPLLLP